MMQADKPAGVSIYISLATPAKDAATISHVVRPSDEQVFVAHRASTPAGGARQHRGTQSVTTARSGQLRLVREGQILTYQYAERDGDAFQDLYQSELGVADLEQVRLAADNGGGDTAVDVRIPWITITATDVPAAPPPVKRSASGRILAA